MSTVAESHSLPRARRHQDLLWYDDTPLWPETALEALQKLTGTFPPMLERRMSSRIRHLARGVAHRESVTMPAEVFVRDANPWSLGFLTQTAFGSRERVSLIVSSPTGLPLTLTGRVGRLREFTPGWFEGRVDLDHAEHAFDGR